MLLAELVPTDFSLTSSSSQIAVSVSYPEITNSLSILTQICGLMLSKLHGKPRPFKCSPTHLQTAVLVFVIQGLFLGLKLLDDQVAI